MGSMHMDEQGKKVTDDTAERRERSLTYDLSRLTVAEKIQLLASRSHTCVPTARRWYFSERVIKGSAGERLQIAARELGIVPSARKVAA